MSSKGAKVDCCFRYISFMCTRNKRRRLLAFRISWKRLRLIFLIVLLAFICLQLADVKIKFSVITALAFFADDEIEVGHNVRLIYTADSAPWFNAKVAMQLLRDRSCPVQNCLFTSNRRVLHRADSVVFRSRFDERLANSYIRPAKQTWIFLSHEAAVRERAGLGAARNRFNYTVTYLRESTVYLPYWTFVPNASLRLSENANPEVVSRRRSYDASSKRGKVAWLVSNCHDVQNNRFEYAEQLGKHIQLDILGDCGKRCSELSTPSASSSRQDCFDYVAQNYKFYLAFENANCAEYISEKLLNAFNMRILPIVMGARPSDYARLAPPHSYIHVEDFRDPLQLAEYLLLLDANYTLYNAYFAWQELGTVAEPRYIGPHYWCRICQLVNEQFNGTQIRNTLNELNVDLASWWTKQRCLLKGKRWDSATPQDFA